MPMNPSPTACPSTYGLIARAAAIFASSLRDEGLRDHLHRIDAVLTGDPSGDAATATAPMLGSATPFEVAHDLIFVEGDAAELALRAYDHDGRLLLRRRYVLHALAKEGDHVHA